ncbi:MAG: hypothetical protein ACRD0D_03635 [Acidimicrobiales bacterium]
MAERGERSLEASTDRCRAWPEQAEGPYHRDLDTFPRDVAGDRLGVPIHLGIKLVASDAATPVNGAVVEIWQCDALGRYSGFPPPDPGAEVVSSASAPRYESPPDEWFLRGRQRTDESGLCGFRTIYPGWYPGRTVHIHLRAAVGTEIFTSQLYFPEEVTDTVFSQPPYRERSGRDTTNATDEIFAAGGAAAVLDLEPDGDGYRAGMCFILAPSDESP